MKEEAGGDEAGAVVADDIVEEVAFGRLQDEGGNGGMKGGQMGC